MAITQDNIVGGKIKINGTVYSLVEIVHGGTGAVIWPAATTYVIDTTTLVLHYTSSVNWILASGQNYCYATADVKVMRGSTVQSTITGATLTATALSGTYASNFSISSGNIYGNYLGTTPVNIGTTQNPQGYYCTASFVYIPEEGSQSEAVTATVNQQYNIKDTQNPTVTNVQITVTPKQGDVVVDTIDFNSQTVNFYGTIIRSVLYNWTSTATEPGVDTNGTMRVYLNGSSSFVTVISNGEYYPWSIAENTTLNDRDFTLKLAYSEDTSYWNDATITQERGIITYGIPVIYSYDCDMIPASGTEPGDSVSPYGYARQPYYINGHQNPDGYEYPEVSWYPASFTAQSLGTTETSTPTYIGSSTGSCTAHGKSATQVSVDCYQEINEKFYNGSTVGEKQYGTPYVGQTYYQNPQITSFTSDYYSSSASACSAAGGTAQLSASARVQIWYQMITPWSQTTTEHYIFSSGSPLDVPTTVTDYDVSYTQPTWVSVTPTLSGSGTGFGLDTDSGEVTISNRGNQTGAAAAARSATFTASYTTPDSSLSDSRTVTLYQEANVAYPQYEPIHSLSIQQSGNIPASGGTYTVNYVARQETWTEYSSGYETTHVTSAETISVNGTNCTPSVNSISGVGSFTISVGQNGLSERTVMVTAGDASDYRTQNAIAATFGLRYGSTTINNGDTINVDVVGIYLYDTGNNLKQYTLSKQSGSNCGFAYDSTNQRFTITNISTGTNDWFEVYEASSGITIRFTVYRAAAIASISASVIGLVFPAAGGTQTFTITAAYTTWSLSYDGGARKPAITFSPQSGGSLSGSTTETVSVTASQAMLISQDGTLTITPSDSSLSDITIRIGQDSGQI